MNLIAEIEVGPRYVRTYRNGRTEIATAPATENPQPAKVIDTLPTLAKDETAVKLPMDKWAVKSDGSVEVAYEKVKALYVKADAKVL